MSNFDNARAYCHAIGRDPDEMVKGTYVGEHHTSRCFRPLCFWMMGARPGIDPARLTQAQRDVLAAPPARRRA